LCVAKTYARRIVNERVSFQDPQVFVLSLAVAYGVAFLVDFVAA
jgi:hypothetical protein